jgi:hypothetical protein
MDLGLCRGDEKQRQEAVESDDYLAKLNGYLADAPHNLLPQPEPVEGRRLVLQRCKTIARPSTSLRTR